MTKVRRSFPEPLHSLSTRYNPTMRLMGIIAHPDDEGTFAGSLLIYHELGAETFLVCLTTGQAATHRGGTTNDQELAAMRKKEFAASCEILKVNRGLVLDYPDGKLHRIDLYNAVCDLTRFVRELRPDVIITFGTENPGIQVSHHSGPLMADLRRERSQTRAGRTISPRRTRRTWPFRHGNRPVSRHR